MHECVRESVSVSVEYVGIVRMLKVVWSPLCSLLSHCVFRACFSSEARAEEARCSACFDDLQAHVLHGSLTLFMPTQEHYVTVMTTV